MKTALNLEQTDKLSDFFGNIQNVTLVQTNLRTALDEIIRLRGMLLEQRGARLWRRDGVRGSGAGQIAFCPLKPGTA